MSLLTELDAFFTDHMRCGDLDAGIDWPIVWRLPVPGQHRPARGRRHAPGTDTGRWV